MTIVCATCRQPMPATKLTMNTPDRCIPLGYVLTANPPRCPHCGALTKEEDE